MQARARKKVRVPVTSSTTSLDHRIDQAILWLTITALFLIPLMFAYFKMTAVFTEPRLLTLHALTGLILILWVWQIALRNISPVTGTEPSGSWDLITWAGRNPARWAIVAVGVSAVAQVASTLLSPLPVVSFFGGDEARTGYNLYDSLSILVIFFSVALRFRSRQHLELLIYTLIASGTVAAIYGIAQHFGWDPIGNNAGRTRVIASFGNTLNFGAYMVMTIPATLAMVYRGKKIEPKWLGVLVLALGFQIAGMWFSGGRGPFVGFAAGLFMFFAIAIALLDIRKIALAAAVFLLGAVVAAIIIALPSAQGDIGLERVLSIGSQLQNTSTTNSTEIQGGLTGRFQIWGQSLVLATTWPVPEPEPTAVRILRPVFGLGPDMLIYSYPFVGKPQTRLHSVDHAHNYPLQILVEQGYAGFLILIGSTTLLLVSGFMTVRFLRRHAADIQTWHFVVLALLPTTAGKLAEMQTGVSRISDLAMTFAIVASVLVLYELIVVANSEPQPAATETRTVRTPRPLLIGSSIFGAILVSVALLTLFFGWDIRRVGASRLLATTYDDPSRDVKAFGWAEAQKRAPERETFTHGLADAYLTEAEVSELNGNRELAIAYAETARDLLLGYEEFDPYEWDVQMLLAKVVSRLVTWGETQYAQEMADRYIKTAQLYPSYPSLVGTAATALTSVGLHELAIYYADLAISMEQTTQPWSKAWYAKGRALWELGRSEEAIEALITATEKQPGWEGALLSHQVLGEIYLIKGAGYEELAEFHRQEGSGPILFFEE